MPKTELKLHEIHKSHYVQEYPVLTQQEIQVKIAAIDWDADKARENIEEARKIAEKLGVNITEFHVRIDFGQ